MSWLQKGLCAFFGHRLKVLRIFWDRTRKVECERCKRQFHTNVFMINIDPWDNHWEQIYKNDDKNFIDSLNTKDEDI
jgi:hypothetical protein